jgi:3-isopropylmalate dehydrogenase
MLRYSLGEAAAAESIEQAVRKVIGDGLRTGDIFSEGTQRVGTREMGKAITAAI